jgi:hypothetical protein
MPRLFGAGFCAGMPALFEDASLTFDSNYGAWANRLDWDSIVPHGGGVLPSGPHYPGEASD